MKQIVYVLIAKNFYTSGGIEYACAIASQNIALFCSIGEAIDKVVGEIENLMDKGYYVNNSGVDENTCSRQYWARLENGKGRAIVLEILRKLVSGELTQINHD